MKETLKQHATQNLYTPAFKTKADRALFEVEQAKIELRRDFYRLAEMAGREEAVRWARTFIEVQF